MKEKLLDFLKNLITFLDRIHFEYSLKNIDVLGYSSLSPIDNGDENGHYSKAILWALKNRKKEDIKNIALTGPYGSGKSSILKTFQKNYKEKDLVFLNISLATFKEEKSEFDENGKEIKVDKTDLLRLIEISILEQIFYHEEDSKIPDSRFKKIKSYSQKKLAVYSLGYLLFLLAIYNYFNNYFIQSIFKDFAISYIFCNIIHYVSTLIIALGIFFIILKSVRIISSITINKLVIQNAEIGMGENTGKSILNHHIDEILYFFSIRPYNVVIIEDLDRFQETEIFTKLREVNLLLNNSEKTKRKEIVFVYAVRDDMFTDRDRTKFFDFIIPVIPVINSSNSSEILLKKRNEFRYTLSDNLIDDLSFFIDDMRLLHNITNEFYLYKEKLNENLIQDKLFSIITYKNIYPNDFMKLSCNEGELYEILNLKSKYIKSEINEIENEIEVCKNDILKLDNLNIKNLNVLRLLYISKVIENLKGFNYFRINGENITISELAENEHFEYLKNDRLSFIKNHTDYYNREIDVEKEIGIKFKDIENEFDSTKTYLQRENEINDLNSGKVNSLKAKIQDLEINKNIVRNSKIAELLRQDSTYTLTINESLNKDLINILLRNGYIAEDYIYYISLFHEGSITRSDYQFHISVKNSIKQPFDYKLFKIDKLILKINPIDFETDFILNYSLLDHLLKYPQLYKNQINSIFHKLKDESETSIEFIIGYYDTSEALIKFIEVLCENWTNIWNFIDNNIIIPDLLKKNIFKSIIEFAEIKSILLISNQSNLRNKILSNPLFLTITNDFIKLKKIIEEMDIKFDNIDFKSSPTEMLDYIYQNNCYQINSEMIIIIIKTYGEFSQVNFDNSNYTLIQNSKSIQLIQYIDKNINNYIKKVYLNIPTNVNEAETQLINLLNHKDLLLENKESIIDKVKTKVLKLSSLKDDSLFPILLEKNKATANWENLLYEYDSQKSKDEEGENIEKEISKSSIEFINLIENAEELSKVKIPKEVNSINVYSTFWKKLIQTDEIEDKAYDLITKSSPWWYSDLNFEDLSENKIKSLINNICINPIAESYVSLKENFEVLHIALLEKWKNYYFKIINEITFDSNDLELVLKSKILTNAEKLIILNLCTDETIITNNNLKLLGSILVADNSFILKDNILKLILENNSVIVLDRIKLFIKNSNKFDLSFIKTFLANLGGSYYSINDKSVKAKILKSLENLQLLEILVERKYISSYSHLNSYYRVNHKRG